MGRLSPLLLVGFFTTIKYTQQRSRKMTEQELKEIFSKADPTSIGRGYPLVYQFYLPHGIGSVDARHVETLTEDSSPIVGMKFVGYSKDNKPMFAPNEG
jgi:hypothetical protein